MSTVSINSVVFQCVPGSLGVEATNDVKGGENKPVALIGEGISGECEILVDSAVPTGCAVAPLFATLIALRSGVGAGDKTVTWVDILGSTPETANGCLIDVDAGGDGVQSVKVKWRGTKAEQ